MKNIIVIHGAHALHSNRFFVQQVIAWVYKHVFNFIPRYSTEHPWVDALSGDNNVINIQWSGNVVPYDVPEAANQVATLLQQNPDQEYIFLTKSIGTEIALRGVEQSRAQNVAALIAICPVNKPRTIVDFPVTFYVSDSDIFARFSRVFLWPLKAFRRTDGRVERIALAHTRHDQFVPSHKTVSGLSFLQILKRKIVLL